ncbi:hypothetical protein Esi_0030_0041 [Ectocarpus siliculosus]|uniref:Uncharacterized protein n=1 Tax=Ectocarpus siliculosus TaxID=2880 RepID=D8LKF9_ECTSI|nr:hypothetical protein Esi_0030_0041 [Ectocarpus siliculosus]|eukprot:CBN74549.1 hypothetical protein Esi_0030_0041 [Ectocarpus siliculosus]
MAGTLFPSPEPETPPIDRWARGWVASRRTTVRDWDRFPRGSSSDDGSEGGRSLRSVRSTATGMTSAHRHGGGGGGHARHRPHSSSCKEDSSGVPFPLAPEVREDQSLPPTIPGHSVRMSRKGGDSRAKRGRGGHCAKRTGANRGEGGRRQGSGGESESGCLWDGGTDGSDRQEDDLDSRLKDLGGREWTIDGAGELLIVDRVQGDAMPKTVVSALYNFRDVRDKLAGGENGGGGVGGDDGGGLDGGKRHRDGSGVGKTRGSISGSASFSKERKRSSLSLRRASRRRSSRRLSGSRRRGSGAFFELEPTLQPNLANSLDRPGPGVSVSDGGSLKEGPSWPQDPEHMSRSEYRERQRRQDLTGSSMLDGGEDASSLGFSLGSVQSAPALRGLGLGLNGNAAAGGGRDGGGRRAVSGGRGSGGRGVGRGTSITAFEDVNPFAGGIRVDTSPPAGGDGRGAAGASGTRGDLSPLTASVGGQSGSFFPGAGPESSSVGETSDDPHLALVKDPDWGRNVRGSPKEAGYLPKVKQVSRERPLTHERPYTRNPRDPRNVPARPNAHVSPKNSTSSRVGCNADPQYTGDDGGSTKSSFPSLPMSLTGWGEGGGGGSLGKGGGVPGRPMRGKKGRGMITMTKPKEIIVQGLLR